jgi:site-specific recombinase XerC
MPRKKSHPTRGKTLARDLLNEAELDRLLDACGDGDSPARNRALIALVTGTGIRISEALDLEPKHVDLRRRRVVVGSRNGVVGRQVWLHPKAVPHLRAWDKVRQELGLSECPVFCNLEGERMHSSYYRSLFPKLGQAAKVEKRIYADGLRHVFARRAWEGKATQRSIQLQFGHGNITATVALLERLGLHNGFAEFEASFGK